MEHYVYNSFLAEKFIGASVINGGCRVSFGRVFEGENQREVSRKESGFLAGILEKGYPPPKL